MRHFFRLLAATAVLSDALAEITGAEYCNEVGPKGLAGSRRSHCWQYMCINGRHDSGASVDTCEFRKGPPGWQGDTDCFGRHFVPSQRQDHPAEELRMDGHVSFGQAWLWSLTDAMSGALANKCVRDAADPPSYQTPSRTRIADAM